MDMTEMKRITAKSFFFLCISRAAHATIAAAADTMTYGDIGSPPIGTSGTGSSVCTISSLYLQLSIVAGGVGTGMLHPLASLHCLLMVPPGMHSLHSVHSHVLVHVTFFFGGVT